MKLIELMGVIIIIGTLISFLFIEDGINQARINEVSSRFQEQITDLFNQSITNMTRMTIGFQETLAAKDSEISTKTGQLTEKDNQISSLNTQLLTLQANYNNVNGTITAKVLERLLLANADFRNFTVGYCHAVQWIENGDSLLSPALIRFKEARNTTNQTLANQSKLNYTKAKQNFTGADANLNVCLGLINNANLTNFVWVYRSMLTSAMNMTNEMIQANLNISNSTLVLRHWSFYNVSYNMYLNKTLAIERYIRNW